MQHSNRDLLRIIQALSCSVPYFFIYGCVPVMTSGLYYKPMTIVNDDSRVINKLETSLTDDTRVIIYDCHMFILFTNSFI